MTTIDAMLRRLAAGDDMHGAAGYAFSHFAVVAIALLVSWLVAVLFAPLLGQVFLRPPATPDSGEPGGVMRAYRGFLTGALRARWLTIAVTIGLFVSAVFGYRYVNQQFFPPSDRVELLVDLGLPQNSSIFATEAVVDRFEAILAEDADVERWSTYIGQGAIRFYLPLDVKLRNPFFGQVVVISKSFEARQQLQPRLEAILAEEFPELVSRVAPLELGPPVGWPVQYRVVGPEIEKVRAIALRVADVVAGHPHSRRVNFDWFEPNRELRVAVDQDEARLLGLRSAAVAQALDSAITGSTVTQVRDDIYLVDVVARAAEDERVAVSTLRSLQVPLPNGRAIPITRFATIEAGFEYPQIWRRNRVPTLTVQADSAPGEQPETIVAELEPAIAALNAELPHGYAVELGGIAEESAESRASVFAVVPLMLLLMLSILMSQLRSFRCLFVLLSVVPLGLIGVVGALLLSGRPLGFVAILGILALMGMIAKNALILIEQIEAERAAGKNVEDAVITAASSRFRPIMLTALATVLAMIPIAFTVFWGPMAFAIMGGLFVATMLTLVFLPTLYFTVFRGEDDAARATAPAGTTAA